MKAYLKVALCLVVTSNVAANEKIIQLNADVTAGVINNSALAIKELDDISSQGDSGITLSANLEGKWQINEQAKAVASYKFERFTYQEFNQYDLTLHQYSLDNSYRIKKFDLGLRYDGAKAYVANNAFLYFNQASIYLGHLVTDHTYLRANLKGTEKRFTTEQSRNVNGYGFDTALFHFINQANTMLLISVNANVENAIDDQYSFKSHGLSTKLSHKFNVLGMQNKAGVGWQYNQKDYLSVPSNTPPSPPERDAKHNVYSAFWHLNLFKNLAVITKAEYGDYQSQLDTNTYTQTVTSMALKVNF